jgi:hypothetical protein
MTPYPWANVRRAALAATLLLGLGALPQALQAAAPPAKGVKATVKASDGVSATVKVVSIDHQTRHLTVMNTEGEHFTLKAPPEVRNFDQLKVGSTIQTRYTFSTEYVVSKPNSPLPANAQTVLTASAAKGDIPNGAVVNHITITGAVVGVDKAKHTMKLVNPKGGEVYNIQVQKPDGIRALEQVKVGDTITAYVSESLLIAVNP